MDIIDIHSHIGDILNKNGGDLINKKGIRDRNLFDTGFKIGNLFDAGFYAGLIKYQNNGKELPKFVAWWKTRSGQKRNASATYENFDLSMNGSDVNYACCLPIAPFVTFEDINAISDDRIIPFTSVDFNDSNFAESLRNHYNLGAKGLKLHPIIQQVSLTDDKTREVVEEFGQYGLPILFHSGVTGYYLGKETEKLEQPSYGNIDDAKQLISSYPAVPFIVGHAGILQVGEVIEKLAGYENTFVDASFQSPSSIRKLLDLFGTNRVMYASDWPYGDRTISINIMKDACGNNKNLENKVFYENAAQLLKL